MLCTLWATVDATGDANRLVHRFRARMSGTICIIHPSKEESRRLRTLASEVAEAQLFDSAETFLEQAAAAGPGCVIVPSDLTGVGSRGLIETLRTRRLPLRVIVIGCSTDVAAAVEQMRAGASEYIEPPVLAWRLRFALRRALAHCHP